MGKALYEMRAEGRWLRGMVLLAVGLGLILPIFAGLAQTFAAAFGIFPALGYDTPSLAPWRHLAELPGVMTSLRLAIVTGIGASLISLILATTFCAAVHARMTPEKGVRWLAPFLAAPHAAMAIGLAFVLAPSGWIARIIAPVLGWDRPPDLALVNDGAGFALVIGLIVKEMPFLLLVILSALSQIDVRRQLTLARSLGYGRGIAWIKVIMPQVWPLIRLPFYVVLAYALSTVDMAIILGPSSPPTLAVAVARWYSDPDPSMFLLASAGAVLQGIIVILSIFTFRLCETLFSKIGLWWLRRGGRGLSAEPGLRLGATVAVLLMLAGALAMISLLVWSFAWRWPFPDLLPQSWSVNAWTSRQSGWGRALGNTLVLAMATTALSVTLAIAWLEGEDRAQLSRARWAEAVIYLPLIVPQIAFLFGLHVVFLRTGGMTGLAAVIWAQSLFVFPYVMISLSDPWRAIDPRFVHTAAALGAGPTRRLLTVKLPLLLQPILTAAGIGVAVSVAQYLPTLFLGAGRIATLTTEAVTLSSSSDRRVTGVYASLQAVLPFATYALAFLIPAVLYRNRRDLQGNAMK